MPKKRAVLEPISSIGKPGRQSQFIAAAIVGGAIALVFAWFWWRAEISPTIRFLPPGGRAEWIVYPMPANVVAQRLGERSTTFRRSFTVKQPPSTASLRVCALGEMAALRINNSAVALPSGSTPNWKRPTDIDVAKQIRPGTNEIVATVSNGIGPPALWLSLDAGDASVGSGTAWEATLDSAVPQPARLAVTTMPIHPGNPIYGGEQTWPSLQARWPVVAGFALLSAGLFIGFVIARRRHILERFSLDEKRWPRIALLVVTLLWVVLYFNNSVSMAFPVGFDVPEHLKYVDYIQRKGSLPLATDGWEMHQPPLYYLMSATALGFTGLKTTDAAAVSVLRFLNFALALVQIGLVAACLRLLFPSQPGKQAAGLIVGAFIPMQLYMAHYETNDLLTATLATAAVYCCLRLLAVPVARVSTGLLVGLGSCLGGTALSKLSGLAMVPIVLAVLAGHLIAARIWDRSAWLRILGVPLALCTLIAGWHYVRVWAHFGTPFMGSFNVESGFKWWQDPGFNTWSYFVGFGRSLAAPFFSEFNGYADGLYSTLWGDALWGGVGELRGRPPWNYDLMAAGYLLALLPTVALLLGVGLVLVTAIRKPRSEWFLLLGIPLVMGVAMLHHYLQLPYACHVKAFYGLPALVPLCAFAAWGFDALCGRWMPSRLALWTALGAWALTAYAAYWVQSDSAATQVWRGHQWTRPDLDGRPHLDLARECYQRALRIDPHNEDARIALATKYVQAGDPPEAVRLGEEVVKQNPANGYAQYCLATFYGFMGRNREAIEHFRAAIRVGPDHFESYSRLAYLLLRDGHTDEAIGEYRVALSKLMTDPQAHYYLGMALAQRGRFEETFRNFRQALQWNPDWPQLLDSWARILATCEDARFRNGPEAVRMASRACELTAFRDVHALDSLAAACAEVGRYEQAARTIQHALSLLSAPVVASREQREQLVTELRERLRLYESNQPYRETPRLP